LTRCLALFSKRADCSGCHGTTRQLQHPAAIHFMPPLRLSRVLFGTVRRFPGQHGEAVVKVSESQRVIRVFDSPGEFHEQDVFRSVGGDVNKPAADGTTAIHRAVLANDLKSVQALIKAGMLQVQCLIGQLRALVKAIGKYETRLSELMDEHPDAILFRALPGAGPALAPRLLVAFGTDRERFQTAAELQSLSGVAPVTSRSGKRCNIHRRWACPKFLLQTFHEFAHCSCKRSIWSKAFYLQQRSCGKGHHAALRTLAFKWIRILFRCWKTKTPYSEERYLDSLRRRNAPLLAFLPTLPTAE
jgi:hypothetical protein